MIRAHRRRHGVLIAVLALLLSALAAAGLRARKSVPASDTGFALQGTTP